MEIYKDIKEYEGIYQISNYGNVKSLIKNKVLKQYLYENGYLFVRLYNGCIAKQHLVHRLVAQTFIPNPDNLPQVNHKDENKENNCVDNLEWCTHKYNCNYGTRNKRRSIKQTNRKDLSKNVLQFTKDEQLIAIYPSIMEAQRHTGICHNNISNCCCGYRNTAGGYKWRYA